MSAELCFKFTGAGAVSPFTGVRWPRGGAWLESEGEPELCRNGVHACRAEALPRWLDAELWRVEVEGVALEHDGVVVARRGRLLERVAAWNADTSLELARSCAARARRLAEEYDHPLLPRMAEDIGAIAEGPDPSATALSMYCTAHAADVAIPGGYALERRRQAEWLRARLALQ